MRHFIFCHGFGFNYHFWDNLASYFVNGKCTFLDLGYFKEPSYCIDTLEGEIIGVGHSLGVLKLLKLQERFDCLIGLNGFVNFLGNDLCMRNKRQLELEILKKNFQKNPRITLKNFYKRCGVSSFTQFAKLEELDLEAVMSDLELLTLNFAPPSIPMLIIAAKNDVIVPPEITHDNFPPYSNVEVDIIDKGQHGLGFLEASYVYKSIKEFVDERFAD